MPDGSCLRLRIFDGSRQLFSAPAQFLVRIVDGNQTQRIWEYYSANDITFNLPFFDNLFDNYSVVVSSDGHQQAGFVPVKLSNRYLTTQDIMLIPKNPGFNFAGAPWPIASSRYPFIGA